jgi:hypothetical protein
VAVSTLAVSPLGIPPVAADLPPAELLDPPRPEQYAARLRMAAHDELPPALRSHFDPRGPLYVTTAPIALRWRRWVLQIAPGLYTDASSIPLWLRPLGVSRWSPHLELVPASLVHDAWWRGLIEDHLSAPRDARFSAHKWHALVGNRAYQDVAIASGYRPWRAAAQRLTLDVVARFAYRGPTTRPNPGVIRVVEI